MIKTTDENGGILGKDNTPTKAVASGIWNLNTVATSRHDDIWPSSSFFPFEIGSSLRFDGGSYLSRGFTGGNKLSHTISVWVKRTQLTGSGHTDSIISAGATGDTNRIFLLSFNTSEKIELWGYSPDAFNQFYQRTTNAVFRDLSAWYHIVLAVDFTNQTGHDRVKLYVNGSQITSFSTESTSNASTSNGTSAIGYSYDYNIGRYNYGSQQIIRGAYMSEFNFLDGYVPTTSNGGLDSSGNLQVLGETKNSVWIPKDPSGLTYGTNGFRLTFSDATSTTTLGYDSSGNNNHWTLN